MRPLYQKKVGDRWADITEEEYRSMLPPDTPGLARKLLVPPTHTITARTWWSGSGGVEYRAELCDANTGNEVFAIQGYGRGWEYDMRDRMAESGLFPRHENRHPTIYFREICNVPYDHREVQRKKDL